MNECQYNAPVHLVFQCGFSFEITGFTSHAMVSHK